LRQPGEYRPAGDAVGLETYPSVVRHTTQALSVDQAGLGVEPIGSTAERTVGQFQKVGGRIVTSQAEPETAPAAWNAVTSALVAAGHVQRGD
jgi:hypothetical protein